MKISGTLINYYFNCKRQCWLFGNKITLEDNSEDVHIGKSIHEIRENSNNTELMIDNVRIDKITNEYLVEVKKSDANEEAAKWQLMLYLKVIKDKGINRKGKLEFVETKKSERKTQIIELDNSAELYLLEIENEILELINANKLPDILNKSSCKKCAYYTFCYL